MFTANKTVTATGMKVQAKAEGSLVITNTSALPTVSTNTVTYNFADATATELYASTHSWETISDGTGSATGLKYITNTELISPETGLPYTAVDGGNLKYNYAGSGFYKDYSFYLAASGMEIKDQKIKIELDGVKNSNSKAINKAVSVDFYYALDATSVPTISSTTAFAGTLNVAGLDATVNDAETTKTEVYIGSSSSGVNIPKNDAGKVIAVVMRVYFDGALKEVDEDADYLLTTPASEAGPAYDNRGGAITLADDATFADYFQEINTACDKTFARNVEMENIANVTLGVKITAMDKAA